MAGAGSPCGACKFLRRKCVRGCVFAPYFCHDQGAAHFSAIHKVFGASNVSRLLSHLPVSQQSEAALTISYEAQARLRDPIYGCVSHIFALQQQVVNLQAQLASLKEQATSRESLVNGCNSNPSERAYGNITSSSSTSFSACPQDVHRWLQSEYPDMVMPQFGPNSLNTVTGDSPMFAAHLNEFTNTNTTCGVDYFDRGSSLVEEDVSYGSYDGSPSMGLLDPYGNNYNNENYNHNHKWNYNDSSNDLHSVVAFSCSQH